VRVLMADRRPAGSHAVTWDGTDDSGRRVASGVYFCEMRAGRFLDVTRLVLLK
jgi:flagellar hook assembly protein FlgD